MKPILPQTRVEAHVKSTHSTFALWQRRHMAWLSAAIIFPLGLTLTAYGVVEYGPAESIEVNFVSEVLNTPATLSPRSDDAFWREEIIQTGDSLGKLFAKLSINDTPAWDFIRNDSDARKMYELSAGRLIRAQTRSDGSLLELSYLNKAGEQIRIVRNTKGPSTSDFTTQINPAITLQQTEYKTGKIESSFYAATDAAGIPDTVAQQVIDLFEGQIDFHHDLQKGDQLSVIYEKEMSGGELVKTGRILAAQLINNGKSHEVMWHTPMGGEGAYYRLDGSSTAESFLTTPVKFSRISSGFSMRFHPVLFKWKSHKGVDYAAPTGTDIRVTADGVVTKITTDGGYGKHVEVKHNDKYSTLYAHMSAFDKNIKVGKAIKQGERLGAVGQTGRVTGPHLHYEFKVNGTQVNPLTLNLPNNTPLNASQMAQFKPIAAQMQQQLALLNQINLAKLD